MLYFTETTSTNEIITTATTRRTENNATTIITTTSKSHYKAMWNIASIVSVAYQDTFIRHLNYIQIFIINNRVVLILPLVQKPKC